MRPGGRPQWGAWTGIFLPILALMGILVWVTVRHQQSLEIGAALARGEAPPVPGITLQGFDGRPLSLKKLEGHPAVLNFWASWCVPCREEAPMLESIWKEYRAKGLVVIGVDTQDLESPARRFLSEHGITYLNVRDPDGSTAHMFGTTGVPETFFIGPDGRIRGKFPGAQLDRATWRATVEALLAGRARVP